MKLTRKSALIVGIPAAAIIAGSIGGGVALASSQPGAAVTLYGCVNLKTRTLDHTYTVAQNFPGCGKNEFAVTIGAQGPKGATGPAGRNGQNGLNGLNGKNGKNGVSGYQVFSTTQSFGDGGVGGAWCGAPTANTTNKGWVVLSGGAELTSDQVNSGVAVAASYPNTTDPDNPGWTIELNKSGTDPGNVTVYAVCAKASS